MSTRVVIAGYNAKKVVKFVAINILTLVFFLVVLIGVLVFAFREIRAGTYQGRNLHMVFLLCIFILYLLVKQIKLAIDYSNRAAAFVENGRFYFLHKYWGWVSIKDVRKVDHEPGKIYFLMNDGDVRLFSTELFDLSAEGVARKINGMIER